MVQKAQITTITIFDFKGFASCFYALKSMADFIPKVVAGPHSPKFVKLMGSGSGNGFSVWPNFGRYALLATWEDESQATQWFESNLHFKNYLKKVSSHMTFFMQTTMAHGLWSEKTPFEPTTEYNPDEVVCVLTRATIRWRDMIRFWKHVPPVSGALGDQAGPILALGIGEMPFRYQATFSLWKTGHDMKAYAYKNHHHQDMIKKTRQIGWYSEELFARFRPYKVIGDHALADTLEIVFH